MRQALPGDVPLLVALMTEFYAETATPLDPRRAADAFAALLADGRLGNVWLIRTETQDVGYVVVTFCHSLEFGGKNAFVDDLFIQAAFRGAGPGHEGAGGGEDVLREPRGARPPIGNRPGQFRGPSVVSARGLRRDGSPAFDPDSIGRCRSAAEKALARRRQPPPSYCITIGSGMGPLAIRLCVPRATASGIARRYIPSISPSLFRIPLPFRGRTSRRRRRHPVLH